MTNESATRRGYAWLLILCVMLISQGCARTFSGRLVDSAHKPVSGALVYIEAYTSHAYAFSWSVSGDSGEVPGKGQPPLRLFMRPGAKLTYCVLASGQYPFIVNDREKVFLGTDISFVVGKNPLPALTYNPLLFHLDFPFENNPGLQKKLMLPSNRLLIETFHEWYRDAGEKAVGIGPEAVRKIEVVDSIVSVISGK
jgi:hypothetical protein